MRSEDPPDPPKMHPKRLENREQEFIYVGDKARKQLQKAAWDAGWWPSRKRSGIMWLAPDRVGQVMLHGSESDNRAYNNALAAFRRFGLKV